FPTPRLAAAAEALADRLAATTVAPPRVPVWSNATAAPYGDDPDGVRRLLAGQVATPVAFRDQVEAMYAAGTRVFVEAGPGRVLTQLVGRTLGDRPHTAVACEVAGEPGVRRFLLALAELAAAGVAVDADPLFGGRDAAVVDVPPPPRRPPFPAQRQPGPHRGRPAGPGLPARRHRVPAGRPGRPGRGGAGRRRPRGGGDRVPPGHATDRGWPARRRPRRVGCPPPPPAL